MTNMYHKVTNYARQPRKYERNLSDIIERKLMSSDPELESLSWNKLVAFAHPLEKFQMKKALLTLKSQMKRVLDNPDRLVTVAGTVNLLRMMTTRVGLSNTFMPMIDDLSNDLISNQMTFLEKNHFRMAELLQLYMELKMQKNALKPASMQFIEKVAGLLEPQIEKIDSLVTIDNI